MASWQADVAEEPRMRRMRAEGVLQVSEPEKGWALGESRGSKSTITGWVQSLYWAFDKHCKTDQRTTSQDRHKSVSESLDMPEVRGVGGPK